MLDHFGQVGPTVGPLGSRLVAKFTVKSTRSPDILNLHGGMLVRFDHDSYEEGHTSQKCRCHGTRLKLLVKFRVN